MNLKLFLAALVVVPALAVAAPFPDANYMNYDANGNPIPNQTNDGTPDVYQAINRVIGSNTYGSNADVMGLFTEPDYQWEITDPDAEIVLIGMTAGYTNTIGYYQQDANGTINQTALLSAGDHFGWLNDGTQADPYSNVASLNLPIGSEFGWYLDVNTQGHGNDDVNPELTYYSEPSLNPEVIIDGESMEEGMDHMMTFNLDEAAGQTVWVQGQDDAQARMLTLQSAYLLCWEDLYQNHPDWADYDYDDMMYVVAQVRPTQVPEPALLSLLGISFLGLAWMRKAKK
ncbi:MAG: PEP-CTERM sorting domain-containing protein [Chitinivibrionales bacterium]